MSARTLPILLLSALAAVGPAMWNQIPLAAQTPANTTQRGTVKAVAGSGITMATDTNVEMSVTPAEGAKILQLTPGSKDLSGAMPITLSDIAPGDRILVTGHPGGAPATLSAARIILMKSTQIASMHASESADWQRRGTGGLVRSVDGPVLTVSAGTRSLIVKTTGGTVFRRYAGDSVKFEDARPGALSEIQTGDQLRVRGAKSDDGNSITADEIVSGSFENLAGALSAVDPAAGTVTLKDLATRKTFTVHITALSEMRNLPPQAAAAFTRSHAPGGPGSGPASPGSPSASGSGIGPSAKGDQSATRSSSSAASTTSNAGAPPQGGGQGHRAAGMDLSQLLPRLPTQTLADLHPGDAVLIVASRSSSGDATAITLLSGVEQLLSATSSGAAAPTLSPWSLGGGEAAGGAPGGGGE